MHPPVKEKEVEVEVAAPVKEVEPIKPAKLTEEKLKTLEPVEEKMKSVEREKEEDGRG